MQTTTAASCSCISPSHAPIHAVSSQPRLEVVPGSPRPTAVTEKGPTANQNVHLVQIVGLVVGGFVTKGALAENDVRRVLAGVLSGNAVVFTVL